MLFGGISGAIVSQMFFGGRGGSLRWILRNVAGSGSAVLLLLHWLRRQIHLTAL